MTLDDETRHRLIRVLCNGSPSPAIPLNVRDEWFSEMRGLVWKLGSGQGGEPEWMCPCCHPPFLLPHRYRMTAEGGGASVPSDAGREPATPAPSSDVTAAGAKPRRMRGNPLAHAPTWHATEHDEDWLCGMVRLRCQPVEPAGGPVPMGTYLVGEGGHGHAVPSGDAAGCITINVAPLTDAQLAQVRDALIRDLRDRGSRLVVELRKALR